MRIYYSLSLIHVKLMVIHTTEWEGKGEGMKGEEEGGSQNDTLPWYTFEVGLALFTTIGILE